ncbi:MAG: hypothetical protein PHP10_03895 [Candidatus Omnitrophica bacterium]|nr:hypothetical protein [Candidatus Omnitrophota bacterium]
MRISIAMGLAALTLSVLAGCSSFQLAEQRKETIVDSISPNAVTVTFCGNAYMDQKEVEKYALQRASREALSKGCSHFIVVRKDDKSKICSLSSGMNKRHPSNAPPVKNSGYVTSSEFVEPNVTLTIQCVPKGEKIPEGAIDAQEYLRENFPGLEE